MYTYRSLLFRSRQRRRGSKKVGGTESCIFSTYSCKFPTEDIIGVQNFDFNDKYPP